MKTVLIIKGPNFNMLGKRESQFYGSQTLENLTKDLQEAGAGFDMKVEVRQSNAESEIIEWVHDAMEKYDGLIINAAAYTHTSVAIHDALKMLDIPVIEVHMSNPHAREDFRKTSFISPLAKGIIAGFGAESYTLALQALNTILAE